MQLPRRPNVLMARLSWLSNVTRWKLLMTVPLVLTRLYLMSGCFYMAAGLALKGLPFTNCPPMLATRLTPLVLLGPMRTVDVAVLIPCSPARDRWTVIMRPCVLLLVPA